MVTVLYALVLSEKQKKGMSRYLNAKKKHDSNSRKMGVLKLVKTRVFRITAGTSHFAVAFKS